MAKKASNDTTTTWILLSEARARVIKAYDGAEELAEKLLVKWLGKKKLRWSCKLFEGPSASDLPALQRKAAEAAAVGVFYFAPAVAFSEGDPAFWRTGPKIKWEKNSAHEQHVVGGASAYGVKVVLEDALALLPDEPSEPEEATATKKWITAEVQRMKRAGEIPDGIRKTAFAQLLEGRMKEAVHAGGLKKLVGRRYITNQLSAWGLWPISSIK